MVYYRDDVLLIRNMEESDAQVFTDEETAQGWHPDISKYRTRLRDQADGKCISLTAVYEGHPAGYINVYLTGLGGAFKGKGWPEIVDFGVLEKYQRRGIGGKLMDAAEQIAGQYADTIWLGVGLHSGYGSAQRMYVKRGYIPDGTGVWYQGKQCEQYETEIENDDDLQLFFSKKLCTTRAGDEQRSLKTMKYAYSEMPESMRGNYADISRDWGFCWKEFVMTVPSPMFLVTTYKANGLTNACMQSWSTFTSANHGKGYYAILGSVNKVGHLYNTLKEKQEAVINFFSADFYDACMATIRHNEAEADEISAAGLTAEPASWVNAPMVRECFMNLECRYVWEKEIVPGDDHVMICLEVIGAHIDETYLADKTGEKGLLYNIHYQLNPERIEKNNHDYAGVIVKKIDMGEY